MLGDIFSYIHLRRRPRVLPMGLHLFVFLLLTKEWGKSSAIFERTIHGFGGILRRSKQKGQGRFPGPFEVPYEMLEFNTCHPFHPFHPFHHPPVALADRPASFPVSRQPEPL